jgi:uncharacterized protein (TIGR03118 family)
MKRAAGCLAGAFLFGLGILGCGDDEAPAVDGGARGSGGAGASGGGSADGGATSGGSGDGGAAPGDGDTGFFETRLLVADEEGVAEHVDMQLVGPWGIASGPETFLWVANEESSTATLYDGNGGIHDDAVGGVPVILPKPSGREDTGPTGIVFNTSEGFRLGDSPTMAPAHFLFATSAGTLIGWNPEVDLFDGVIAVDNSEGGAVYTDLAIATTSMFGELLFVANFAHGVVEVYDETFSRVLGLADLPFLDEALPEGYAPFGVEAIGGRIFVSYARQDPAGTNEVTTGAGRGFVSVFELDGTFVARVAAAEPLDAPWGMVRAPSSFGPFAGALLVGNLGDGRITAIDPDSREVLGQLEDEAGDPIVVEGLRGLHAGNGATSDDEAVYFTAAPGDGEHGLFGDIRFAVE